MGSSQICYDKAKPTFLMVFFIFDWVSNLLVVLNPYLMIQVFVSFLFFFRVPPYLYPSVFAKSSQQYLQIKIQLDVCEFFTLKWTDSSFLQISQFIFFFTRFFCFNPTHEVFYFSPLLMVSVVGNVDFINSSLLLSSQ